MRPSTRSSSGAIVAAAAAVALLATAGARAQPPGAAPGAGANADQSANDRARTAFERAEAHYAQGRYEAAADAYLTSYRASPHAELLLNAAQALRLAGQLREALVLYQKFVAVAPEHRFRDDAEAHIEALKSTLYERRHAPDGTGDASGPPAEEPARAPPAETGAKSRDVVAPGARERGDGGGRELRITGISVAAVGAAGLVLAGVFAWEARSIEGEIDGYDAWTDDRLDRLPGRIEDGERAETRAILAGAAGAGAVAVGAIVYALGRAGGGERGDLAVVPSVAPDRATVTIGGVF